MGKQPGRVVMLVKNSFQYDARVRKEAASLLAAGHAVTVVALHVPGVTVRSETTAWGLDVVRVPQFWSRRPRWLGPSTATAGSDLVDATAAAPTRSGPAARARRLLRRGIRPLLPMARRINREVVDRRMVRAGAAWAPGVVHAHDLNTLRPGTRLAHASGARLVYDAHEYHRARNGMTPREQQRAGRLEDRLAPRADLLITATDSWADDLAGRWGRRPVVVRNAPARRERVAAVDLHAATGAAADRRLLVYVGSVQSGRGIEESMAALPLLPDCDLVVIGYGAHGPALRAAAREAGLRNRVHFLPPVDNEQVVDWVAGADVGLCLIVNTSFSYYTSLPNKLLDYVQARLPVVTSDFPEMGRVAREHEVGEVCDPAEPASVAAAVRKVLDGGDAYAGALLTASERLTWEAESARLLAGYRALAAPERGSGVPLQ